MVINSKTLNIDTTSLVTQPAAAANNIDEEFNNQFQQLLAIVKKSNCKFGDFSRAEAKDNSWIVVKQADEA